MVSKVILALCALLVFTGFAYAQTPTLNWKVASESPNADSASNMTLGTLRTLIVAGTGSGSVTSVNSSLGGFTSSGAVTSSGTIAFTYSGATGLTKATNSGGFSTATSGTDYSAGTSANTTGIVKSTTGTGVLTTALAGTDYLAPFASQTANQIFAAPSGSAGVPSFRAIVAADIPILNQNTLGSAATAGTVTTNANLTGVVTSVGNATSIASSAITNAMLANPTTSVNGVTLTLGGTNAAAFTLANVTGVGASTTTASTFSGGLTASGTNALSGATTASGGLTVNTAPLTLQVGAQLIEVPATTVTTTGTIGTGTVQMPLNITSNSTLTLTAGAASGTLMECIMIPTSTAQVIFTSSTTETFNGNATFTVVAGSQNTTIKFYKYSTTAWRVSLIQ